MMSRPRATQHLGARPIRRPQPVNARLVVWGSNPPVTMTDGRRRRQQSRPTRPGEPRQRSPADPVQHPFPEQRQDASTASLTTPPALNTTETNMRLTGKVAVSSDESTRLLSIPCGESADLGRGLRSDQLFRMVAVDSGMVSFLVAWRPERFSDESLSEPSASRPAFPC